ncbi:nse1 non-SMC component of SMC5-6 complex domain-containing protein [Hirsutella rhossiliensis]|uniref:Non-structural maintenance of chromosomes element 1 homolog n=1 Tax=Hirsutella rhossiliensis TaxID=111463 RepID=A0A9P8N4M9_9HYPO|nr:nse1 non-SMC component of SMC5-6 complex domain-containing protein [Hirsutella rhossiliensis]KAH0964572.1 nse1 non-SMC component of SMC5-6 complex domain-containing protein [Hirsutella rhossiliensis]
MEDLLSNDYDNRHRAFLQALLARGTVTFEESQTILAAIFNAATGGDGNVRPDQVSEEDFLAYIEAASDAASLFDYEIRSTVHQLTKQRIYALVNTTSDPQTQLATTFSPEELAFIKRALDGMFDKFNRPRMEVLAMTEMQAIKFARPNRRQSQGDAAEASQVSSDKGLKHSEVETILANLVDGGWFEKSKSGFYSVTPRALLELRPWLMNMYNDPDAGPDEWQRIKFCEACKDIVTTGLRCSEPSCTLRLHDICQEAFWRARRTKECPHCSREWTGLNYVGERAVTMTEAYQRGRRRSGGKRSTLADDVIRQEGMEEDRSDGERDEGGE